MIKALLDACWSSDCLWEDVDIRFSHPSVSMPAECEARRWRSIMIKYLRKSLKSGRRGRRATPLCKTMEFSYMDSLCKKNPHISMSFTLPVCPFLFFSSCWKPSHFIEQIFESLNRSRADPEPNRHAARLRLRSAGMGSSPSLGRLTRRARRAAASTDVASQRQSFASCNPFNLGGCSSGEFEGFGKEEHARPMISLL